MKAIVSALIKAQKKIKHAQKDAKNPHFKNHYATLESVIDATKEALLENDIAVVQLVTKDNLLVTSLIHSSGEYINSEMNLLNVTNMQQMGSSLTYSRRYSLAAILNIAQTDDDGNSSVQETQSQAQKKEVKIVTSPADYEIKFGKLKGKKLKDIPGSQLKSMNDWLIDESKKNNKPLIGTALEFVNVYELYSSEANNPPALDQDDEVPF